MSRPTSVLIVDDDESCRSSIELVLEEEGCKVYTADNGQRALEVLHDLKPDLLVVDLVMPIMNGWDLCAALERDPELAEIPVVILSSVARFRPLGRRRVLAKPVTVDTLLALLDFVEAP